MTKEPLTGELADAMKVRPETIPRWRRSGRIPQVYVSRRIRRFRLEAVMETLDRGRRPEELGR